MPDTTTQADTQAKFRVEIRGSIEDVWQEITRTDAPIAAFFTLVFPLILLLIFATIFGNDPIEELGVTIAQF